MSDHPISFARDALERHAWKDAYEALIEADRTDPLPAAALEMLAWATYWTGRPDATIEALERAYAAYLDEGDRAQAAMMAYRLAEQHGMRMSIPLAQGWGQKAARLAEEDATWPVHGWLIWIQGLLLWIMENDYAGAIQRYDEALAFAERSGDRDLAAMSLHDKGHALCLLGDVATGMPLLDECMATVVGGELDPAVAGYIYCGMIGICSKLGDYGRASEWTDATLRWCERRSVPAFPGVCRIHRAELKLLHGHLHEAEADALAACEELPRYNFISGQGPAYYEIGEVRRQLGDFVAAEEAYARAEAFDRPPHPGRSLLRLAEGKVDAAASGIRQALDEQGADACSRVRLLAAQVTIALASDDAETATSAVDELDTLVEGFLNGLTPCDGRRREGCAAPVRGRRGRRHPDPAAEPLGSGGRRSKPRSRPLMSACSWRRRTPPAEMTMRRAPRRVRHETRSNASALARVRREPGAPARSARARGGAPGAGHASVHVHGHRAVDRPDRGDRRRRLGGPAHLARPHPSVALRGPRRRRRTSDRRRVLRRVPRRAVGAGVCRRRAAGARRASTVRGLLTVGPDRHPCRPGDATGRGLRRSRGPPSGEDRCARSRGGAGSIDGKQLHARMNANNEPQWS